MKTLFVVSVLLLLFFGCTQTPGTGTNNSGPQACTQEAKICPDGSAVGRTGPNCEFAPCPPVPGMNQSDALDIAQGTGACTSVGHISVIGTYNNNSQTWWFDISADKPGCNPACVVYESNKSAEVNWRCTGLVTYTVKTANTSLGEILVDGNGYTLYVFSDDSVNKSFCLGGCPVNWPPFVLTSDTVNIPVGIPGTIGAFARDNSTIQVSYNGMPLYRYIGDNNPGDTNGQGIAGKWSVVNVRG